MKKFAAFLLSLVLLAGTVSAESIMSQEYTDVPTAATQDSVLSIEATQDCTLEALQPDEESIALLDDVYNFVIEEENRPARYYDEPTQAKIQALYPGLDLDALYMTEAMRLQLAGEPEKPVTANMELDVKYEPGQLVLVVLGIPQGELEYTWYPYRGQVPEEGHIQWDIPVEDWNELRQQPISFHVLTVRVGPSGELIWHEETYTEKFQIFSKDSGDVYHTRRWYSESGVAIDDDFSVYLVELTEPMEEEVMRINEHLTEGGKILDYFPRERKYEALLMLPEDVKEEEVFAYDVIALMDENYKDTYGDVNVEIEFASCYNHEKAMVILAGFEIKDAQEKPYMEWYVLRTEAIEVVEGEEATDVVKIGLKQLNLPRMEEEPMMLVVISQELEPLEQGDNA